MRTLQAVTASVNPVAALTSRWGRHGNHRKMSEELQGWIAEILAKFLAPAEDHCVSQDAANNWLNLGEGVTWRIVWEKLLAERQSAFGAQCVQCKNTWSVDRKKSENRPTLAAYEAASGRVSRWLPTRTPTATVGGTSGSGRRAPDGGAGKEKAAQNKKAKEQRLDLLQQSLAVPVVAVVGSPVCCRQQRRVGRCHARCAA